MATPFALHEQRVNRAVADRLADSEMVCNGTTVAGCMREVLREFSSNDVQPQRARQWDFSAPFKDFQGHAPKSGDTVDIGGVQYAVGSRVIDKSGWASFIVTRA